MNVFDVNFSKLYQQKKKGMLSVVCEEAPMPLLSHENVINKDGKHMSDVKLTNLQQWYAKYII